MSFVHFFGVWFVLFWGIVGFAQPRHDYTWLLGTNVVQPEYKIGACQLDFNKDPVNVIQVKTGGGSRASYQVMSDENGKLLYYTNACDLYTADFKIMEGGEKLNPGLIQRVTCDEENGLGYRSSGINLPYPDRPGFYVFLHLGWPDLGPIINVFYQTTIDMNANGGRGQVIAKNVPILRDSFDDWPTAVRHANGRDWWVILSRPRAPLGFHKFLLTPQGMQYKGLQYPGIDIYYKSPSCFTPDGTKYCFAHYPPWVGVLDFDRGTGVFSNPRILNPPFDSVPFSDRTVAVSPNSRYLYATTGARLWQYDLQATDIAASEQLIYESNKPGEPIRNTVHHMQITPDGRIFVMPNGATLKMHVIQEPDKRGKACRFELDALELPVLNWVMLPYFPNFRLGALAGSPYDTLYVPPKGGVLVTPNPADGEIKVEIATLEGDPQFELYDALGRVVYQERLYDRYTYLPVAFLPSAVYFYRIRRTQQPRPEGGKVVIRH